MKNIAPYAKSVAAALAAGLTALAVALPDGVTAEEWIGIALAVLVPGGVTYAAPKNKPARD